MAECGCPKRQSPPPRPTSLPLPATEVNCDRLRQWLTDYCRTSSFNMCEHQPLNMMDDPPMRLMVDPDAELQACHTPLPVPLHWQDEVKAGFDQDFQLGVN